MRANLLRRARTRIRHDVDFGQEHGDATFLLAVADLLDEAAKRADLGLLGPPYYDALAVARAYLGDRP